MDLVDFACAGGGLKLCFWRWYVDPGFFLSFFKLIWSLLERIEVTFGGDSVGDKSYLFFKKFPKLNLKYYLKLICYNSLNSC